MMTNLSIINILLNRVAEIYIKLKSIMSKLHNTSASIAFIKEELFVYVIPKYELNLQSSLWQKCIHSVCLKLRFFSSS